MLLSGGWNWLGRDGWRAACSFPLISPEEDPEDRSDLCIRAWGEKLALAQFSWNHGNGGGQVSTDILMESVGYWQKDVFLLDHCFWTFLSKNRLSNLPPFRVFPPLIIGLCSRIFTYEKQSGRCSLPGERWDFCSSNMKSHLLIIIIISLFFLGICNPCYINLSPQIYL